MELSGVARKSMHQRMWSNHRRTDTSNSIGPNNTAAWFEWFWTPPESPVSAIALPGHVIWLIWKWQNRSDMLIWDGTDKVNSLLTARLDTEMDHLRLHEVLPYYCQPMHFYRLFADDPSKQSQTSRKRNANIPNKVCDSLTHTYCPLNQTIQYVSSNDRHLGKSNVAVWLS
jgi:hypothetical protein